MIEGLDFISSNEIQFFYILISNLLQKKFMGHLNGKMFLSFLIRKCEILIIHDRQLTLKLFIIYVCKYIL